MSLSRTKTAQRDIFPTHSTTIQRQRRELTRYHQKFQPSPSKTIVKHTLATAPNSPTRELSSSLDSRMKSSRVTTATLSSPLRPKSQRIDRCQNRSSSPLSIIRTRQHCLAPSRPIRTDFLRKGSAVDRAIIKNILMSKLTLRSRPTVSYTNVPQNALSAASLSREIPKGLRDVVGAEEMLRMSHIMLGVDFKTCRIGKLISSALTDIREERRMRAAEDEDSPMLRSIQRW